jgi:phage baseplate assembly protein V
MSYPLRFGLVTNVDAAKARAKVQFVEAVEGAEEGQQGMESHWLHVGCQWSLGAQEFVMPTIGEQVACLMDERCEFGVIVCAIYSDTDPPPSAPAKAWHREFPDGTILQYDPTAHELLAHVEGTATLEATGDVLVHSDADATVQAGGTATVQAADIILDGDVTVTGTLTAEDTITATGEITSGTVALTAHLHSGVTAGGAVSGPPVP